MKIAFCFLTYDNLIRPDIWNIFFEKINESLYSVFIHPKHSRLSFNNLNFKHNIVKDVVITKGKYDISIVRATLRLLQEAYNSDKEITHFIFLTQSCIPLYNFNILYNIITKFPFSVISNIDSNRKERYSELSNIMKKYILFNNFTKQQPNMILIREDVQYFIMNNYTDHFRSMTCPDEHYFINVLKYVFKKKVIQRQINFCNTDLRRTQALEFINIDDKFINSIRSMGFLFMRKVTNKTFIHLDFLNLDFPIQDASN